MCCKEGQRILRGGKDLRMRSHEKSCKAKKVNARASLRQKRKGGRRVFKNAVNGTCTIGRKRIAVKNYCENSSEFCYVSGEQSEDERGVGDINSVDSSPPSMTAPGKGFSHIMGKEDVLMTEADIEALPQDILVRIVCNVHHDELNPLFHVSTKFREAAVIARQMHFDYTTPVRVRASRKRTNSPLLDESSEDYSSKFEGLECLFGSSKRPATPNAPKQACKLPKSRILAQEFKEIDPLDDDPSFISKNHISRSGGGATNRVLVFEDELCEAVARNRL